MGFEDIGEAGLVPLRLMESLSRFWGGQAHRSSATHPWHAAGSWVPPSPPSFPQHLGPPSVLATAARSGLCQDMQKFTPITKTTLGTPHSPLLSKKSHKIRIPLLPLFPKSYFKQPPWHCIWDRAQPSKEVCDSTSRFQGKQMRLLTIPYSVPAPSAGSAATAIRISAWPWAQDTEELGWSLKTWPSSFWRSPKHLLFPHLSRKFGIWGGGARGSSECTHHRLILVCSLCAVSSDSQ